MVKECMKCHRVQSTDAFHKQPRKSRPHHDGLCGYCAPCKIRLTMESRQRKRNDQAWVARHLAAKRRFYQRNKAEIQASQKAYRETEHGKLKQRQWLENARKNPEYRQMEKIKRETLVQRPEYKARQNAWARQRRHTNPEYRLGFTIRNAINSRIDDKTERLHAEELIGCTIEEYRLHIEQHWLEGMDWDNRGTGKGKWSIDHIVPCKLFDLTQHPHQRACFKYMNVRPLWNEENSSKVDRLPDGRRARSLSAEEKRVALINLGFGYLFDQAVSPHASSSDGVT